MYTRNLNEFAGITKNVDDFSDGIQAKGSLFIFYNCSSDERIPVV